MTNAWAQETQSERIKIEEVPQEKKMYLDIAVLAAKRHLKVDSATPVMLEEWGSKAFYGYNGMVDVEAGGTKISVSFTHDLIDEPEVQVTEVDSMNAVFTLLSRCFHADCRCFR